MSNNWKWFKGSIAIVKISSVELQPLIPEKGRICQCIYDMPSFSGPKS